MDKFAKRLIKREERIKNGEKNDILGIISTNS